MYDLIQQEIRNANMLKKTLSHKKNKVKFDY